MARNTRCAVELLSRTGMHMRYVSEREARSMMEKQEAHVPEFAGGWRDRRDLELTVVQLGGLLTQTDAATITKTEMEVNVGEFGRRRANKKHPEQLGNFVDEVMYKIEQWPFVGDDRAVRVCCVAVPA